MRHWRIHFHEEIGLLEYTREYIPKIFDNSNINLIETGPCFAYIIYNSTDEYSQEEHIEMVRNIPFGRRSCFVQKQQNRK